jgi:dTDP-4-dehydrorhamnose 3,5-epimerase
VVDTAAVQVRPLAIDGAFEITPIQHGDDRGLFLEWFKASEFRAAVGHDFELAQANCSVSHAGVVRGIHFADVPPGQAKYITCVYGAVYDVVVDIRVGSPTFGHWDATMLDDQDRRGVFVDIGLGHAFMALAGGATVVYLTSSPYAPEREHGLDPFDAEIGVDWPVSSPSGLELRPTLSPADRNAAGLTAARAGGLLPTFVPTGPDRGTAG